MTRGGIVRKIKVAKEGNSAPKGVWEEGGAHDRKVGAGRRNKEIEKRAQKGVGGRGVALASKGAKRVARKNTPREQIRLIRRPRHRKPRVATERGQQIIRQSRRGSGKVQEIGLAESLGKK